MFGWELLGVLVAYLWSSGFVEALLRGSDLVILIINFI